MKILAFFLNPLRPNGSAGVIFQMTLWLSAKKEAAPTPRNNPGYRCGFTLLVLTFAVQAG
jgi:hypothetical protein